MCIVKNELQNFIEKHEYFSTQDVYKYFNNQNISIKQSTIRFYLSEAIKNNNLYSIGHGLYITKVTKNRYTPYINNNIIEIYNAIREEYPLLTYCIWTTSILNEFHHHISNVNFLIIEVEKDGVESVFYFLKEKYNILFKNPSVELLDSNIINTDNAIVIINLISESPLIKINSIKTASLEKILVDIVANVKLFYYLQGSELHNIYSNAISKYNINFNKLFNYAKRRNKEQLIKTIILQNCSDYIIKKVINKK